MQFTTIDRTANLVVGLLIERTMLFVICRVAAVPPGLAVNVYMPLGYFHVGLLKDLPLYCSMSLRLYICACVREREKDSAR